MKQNRFPNTVNAVYFAGLIFRVWQHKNIYMRVVKFALSRCSLDIFVLNKYLTSYNDTLYKQLGSTKTKQASHILQYITHLHQHMMHQYTTTCPKCAYKISQIFSRVFEFALAEFCAKFAKINALRIFPLLQ